MSTCIGNDANIKVLIMRRGYYKIKETRINNKYILNETTIENSNTFEKFEAIIRVAYDIDYKHHYLVALFN